MNLAAFTIVLPTIIAVGVAALWRTARTRYFVVVLAASLIEYVFWIYWFRRVLTTPEHQATLFEYVYLPTFALVVVMAVSLYALKRQRPQGRA